MITCKNCGTEFDSNYCPNCGQKATSGQRLTFKAFSRHSMVSFARLNDGFNHTAAGLLTHPWRVISDYIHGRRVRYSPPATMLIQVILYTSVIVYLLENIFDTDLYFNDTPYLSIDVGHWFVDFILSSDIFQTAVMIVPASLAGMIAFRWVGGRRYNAAEYLAAGTYMMCLNFMARFLVVPVQLLADGETFGLNQYFMAVMVLVTLWKAFHGSKWWRRALSILFYLVVTFILIVLEIVLIGFLAFGIANVIRDHFMLKFDIH